MVSGVRSLTLGDYRRASPEACVGRSAAPGIVSQLYSRRFIALKQAQTRRSSSKKLKMKTSLSCWTVARLSEAATSANRSPSG